MNRSLIEPLEDRRLLAAALTAADVQTILAQAASQVRNPSTSQQAIVVTDRDGNVLGSLAMGGLAGSGGRRENFRVQVTLLATLRARTGALFASTQNAFTTRTARFIIQDHFPHPVNFTPGGPLYGVQFSNLFGSDITGSNNVAGFRVQGAISGDPGGLPLFKDGQPVGGIGVAGDGHDVAARSNLASILTEVAPAYYGNDPKRFAVFNGKEESDADEQIALAGQQNFAPADEIQANHIFLDGLRVPYVADKPASGQAFRTFGDLTLSGDALIGTAPTDAPASPYPAASYAGIQGFLKNTSRSDFAISNSNDTKNGVLLDEAHRLTNADVRRIFADAAKQAFSTRAAIRKPLGVPAQVHIAVVDRDGDLLGVFKTADGTNFSFDVAVQKARTAAFFSDNAHAFSSRSIGFLAQRYAPPGIDRNDGIVGPLFELQNALSPTLDVTSQFKGSGKNPIRNGITIFPGGVPLYKNGRLVGAVGISGDGVDQDDIIAFAGAKRYQPRVAIRVDKLSHADIAQHLLNRVRLLNDLFSLPRSVLQRAETLPDVLTFRLPYVKFPRNPDI